MALLLISATNQSCKADFYEKSGIFVTKTAFKRLIK